MNYRNSEGYASPTEHEALTRIRHEELKEERQKKFHTAFLSYIYCQIPRVHRSCQA